MNLRKVVGFCIGTFGVFVLIGPSAFKSVGNDLEALARMGCVAAAVCYAVGSILTRRCPEVHPIVLSAIVMLLAAIVISPVALFVEGIPDAPPSNAVFAILYLGVLPTAIAQIVLVKIIREAGPTFMSLVNYQVPIWSVVLGTLILAEPVPASLPMALGLILTGVFISQWRALRRLFFG